MQNLDLTVVVCGAPLTSRTPDLLVALLAEGWRPTVVATAAAQAWLDFDEVERLVGERPRVDYRSPSQPKRGGVPAAVLVCPATFNTINKAAAGLADTYPLGVVCEALGTGIPLVVVPMVSNKLWGHPAWAGSLTVLGSAGTVFVDIQTGEPEASPTMSGTGAEVVAVFDPAWVTRRLKSLQNNGSA